MPRLGRDSARGCFGVACPLEQVSAPDDVCWLGGPVLSLGLTPSRFRRGGNTSPAHSYAEAGAVGAFARLRLWESNAPAKEVDVALLIILALIVALFVGLGFVVKWLFILAVVAALIWVIAFFMRGARA
jgi:hypothetical protein